MECCLCMGDGPPSHVALKGSRGKSQEALVAKQNEPHRFAVSLKDSCCAEPLCCVSGVCCAPFGCTACWARKAVLEKYHNGMDDFMCCQGYLGGCCCIEPETCCKGSAVGLCLEGFCCPVFSLSIARIHLMDAKHIRPDPWDWKIIQCSNCLQCVSCILNVVAIFVEQARSAAECVELCADCFTLSVAGCMAAQISHEIKSDNQAGEVVFVAVEGIPVSPDPNIPLAVAHPIATGGPATQEMER